MGVVVVVIVIINNPVCAVFVSRNSAKLENGPTYSREIKMKLDDTKKSFFYIIVTENVTSNNCMFVVSQSFVRAIQSSLLLLQHEYLLPGIFAANHNVTRSIATFAHRFRRRRISHTHTAVNIHIHIYMTDISTNPKDISLVVFLKLVHGITIEIHIKKSKYVEMVISDVRTSSWYRGGQKKKRFAVPMQNQLHLSLIAVHCARICT